MKNKSTASVSLRKLLLSALVAAPLATLPVPLWALPSSQTNLNSIITPSSGVTVTWTNANRLDVSSTATYGVIKWTDFGGGVNTINSGDLINYAMPSASASILNMVTGSTATSIGGTLLANGNLLIMNPNGITIAGGGIVTANSVTLSTVPETEYSFLTTGALSFVPNQTTTSVTTNAITVSPGATINAASGTGNVWITSAGSNLAGTINGGNVVVASQNNGSVVVGAGGSLTVGNTGALVSNLSVTTTGTGTIAVGDGSNGNVVVYGPSVSLTTGNQTITQGGTGFLQIGSGTGNATLTTNSGTAATSLNGAGGVKVNGSNTLIVNATGAAVAVVDTAGKLAVGGTATGGLTASTAAGDLTLNAATVTGAVAATAAGGNILSGGNVSATTGVTLTVDDNKDITFQGKSTAGGINVAATGAGNKPGNVTITGTSDLALTTMDVKGKLTATAAGNITQVAAATQTAVGNVSLTSNGGNVTLTETIAAPNLSVTANKSITVTAAQNIATGVTLNAQGGTLDINNVLKATALTTLSATASGNITTTAALNATTSTYNAGGALAFNSAITAPTLTATGATITQTGTITSSTTATITGNTSITLTNNGNDFATLVLKGAPSGATVNDTNGLTLGNATNATGNVTIGASKATAADVVLGAASGNTISIAGNLVIDNTATANGNITDLSDNVSVLGNITLSTAGTGSVTLDGNAGTAVGLNNQYGQVNVTTAGQNATIFEKTTANLGAINLGAGTLNVYSASGIINTGRLQVTNVKVGAGTAAAPGDIALNYTSSTTPNSILGTITLQDDLHLLSAGSSVTGNYLAKSLTVSAGTVGAGSLVDIPLNVYGAGATANISITTTGGANLIAGALRTTGSVSLTSGTGSITATNAGNTFTNLTVASANTTAGSAISAAGDLTVNTASGSSVSGDQAITYTSTAGNLTIGTYIGSNGGTTTFAATTAGKSVSDSVTGISIFGPVTFNGGAVSITKSGHSFGGVTVSTTSNGNATIVESGYLKLLGVAVNGTGAFTATSQNGSIVETGAVVAGNATLSAASGDITLNAVNTNALTSLTISQAGGNVAYATGGSIALGNITTNGTLTVDTSSASAKQITQVANATINAYGATSFSTDAGVVTVANSGNRFGGITVDTTKAGATAAGASATLKEQTTINLRSVKTGTAGNLTVTSEGGSIVDSGSGAVVVGGVTTLAAANGNIALALAGSDYTTVGFTTGGNVAITDSVANITLAASTVGGSLTVTNSAGNIGQSGTLVITGDSTFNASAAASSIILNNTANQFGALKFTVGTAGAVIDEVTTMNLKAGTVANGPVTLNTLGNFVTSGTGASSFLYNTTAPSLTINASGTIIPGAGSLLVVKGLTVSSGATKDLSGLSLSGNLAGIAPTNLGTGAYVPPSP